MRYYFMNSEFAIATEKANEVIKKLRYHNDGLVRTEDIIEIVAELANAEIECFYMSFAHAKIADNYGAMMCVMQNDNEHKKNATIIVNSDKDIKFQRFSLVHELGHLITDRCTIVDDENRFTMSAHIQYDITSISEEECKKNAYVKNEQIANIFALRVLMPNSAFKEQLFDSDDFKSIAEFFGVTKDAVRSRALLGV